MFAYASTILFVSKGTDFEFINKTLRKKISMSTSASARGNTIDRDYLMHVIEAFSPEQNHVIDLFFGGEVL